MYFALPTNTHGAGCDGCGPGVAVGGGSSVADGVGF